MAGPMNTYHPRNDGSLIQPECNGGCCARRDSALTPVNRRSGRIVRCGIQDMTSDFLDLAMDAAK